MTEANLLAALVAAVRPPATRYPLAEGPGWFSTEEYMAASKLGPSAARNYLRVATKEGRVERAYRMVSDSLSRPQYVPVYRPKP